MPRALIVAVVLLAACRSPGPDYAEPPPDELEFECSAAPISALPDGVCFVADLPYAGEDDQQRLDLFLVESDEPAPLAIFVHGGGFVSGDKSAAWQGGRAGELRAVLEAGASYATVNYRLLEDGDADGVLEPLGDGQRALQWLRYYAPSLNLDPERVALSGSSAGAGTVLWLGLGEERADPDAGDPVEAMSTRVLGINADNTQATYDVVRWETDVFAPFGGFTLDGAIEEFGLGPRLAGFYGVNSVGGRADLETTGAASSASARPRSWRRARWAARASSWW